MRTLLVWRLEHRLPWCEDKGHGPYMTEGCTALSGRPTFGMCQRSPKSDEYADGRVTACDTCHGTGNCYHCDWRGYSSYLGMPLHMNCGATVQQVSDWWEDDSVAPLANGWAFVLYEVPVGDPQTLRVGRQQVVFDRRKSRELGTTQLLSADGIPSVYDACMGTLTAI